MELLRAQPLASSAQVQDSLQISQATASRLINGIGDRVLRVGRGRATRYAVSTPVLGDGLAVPLSTVDRQGLVTNLAQIRRLSDGRHLVEAADLPPWLAGDSGTGLFRSLPYFLEDQRPSGFLGRLVASGLAAEWNVALDPRNWGDEELGRYLLGRANDLPGSLVVGSQLAEQLASRGAPALPTERESYPRCAENVLGNTHPGSSAAGEQPKFLIRTTAVGEAIVKFSSSGDSAEAGRWRDLLRAEGHAAEVLRSVGFAAPACSVIELQGRVFLECERFDRVGTHGRVGAISLAMVDAEFSGCGQGWGRAGRELNRIGLLPGAELENLVWLETFGTWIGNSDMHFGNVSLSPTETGFVLLPVYDMLPMAFAPVRGELRQVQLAAPVRTSENSDAWQEAGRVAMDYWSRIADDRLITSGFREVAAFQVEQSRRSLDIG